MPRKGLPHRSSLSRFLSDVDRPCLEAFRTLFEQQSFAEGWTSETIGGIFDRQGQRCIAFDVDATRQAARQRALPCDPALPAAKRRLDEVCAPGYTGRKRGEVVRTRTTVLQMHTRQWVGTYAGRGNGDYRGELASALRAISTFLKHCGLTPEVALVRLDGQYGDAAVIVQLIQAGVNLVTRGRGYRILDHPQLQRALAHPPTARVTRMNTGEVIELFDGGWLPMDESLPVARVIVARHRAPPPSKQIPVGKRIGEWVYELLSPRSARTASSSRMCWTCIMDVEHSRACWRICDVEEDPDRWGSYTECGQELWQIACQWVWNLRLSLGQRMQAVQLRDIEWAPPKESPPCFEAVEDVPQEYGPWQWAASFGRATGRFGADAFTDAGRMANSAVQREPACG
jgi:hypothetical protein